MARERTPRLTEKLLGHYTSRLRQNGKIDTELYQKYNVKRGLRNADGTGVLVGLTRIGSVHGYIIDENEKQSVEGKQLYRGIDVQELVAGFQTEHRPGFEECAYLLMFGLLPDEKELAEWRGVLDSFRCLPDGLKGAILLYPGKDIMNNLARAVLNKYNLDPVPDSLRLDDTIRQCIELIAQLPAIVAYSFLAKHNRFESQDLYLVDPKPGLSTAENFLRMLHHDRDATPLEAELLDLLLVLHAEHGGGNNSAFTTHVVTSAFTDTYSAIASAILSLKGYRHGGANLRVMAQMAQMKEKVKDWKDDEEIAAYLRKVLRKEEGDGTGLIYGLGHAVYTLSDPRAVLLSRKAGELAAEKGRSEEFDFYERISRVGPQVFNEGREKKRPLCANVDFYSGFVYDMIGVPQELFTPLFAVSRIVGWSAHHLEELLNGGPIIRPSYKAVGGKRPYQPLHDRS